MKRVKKLKKKPRSSRSEAKKIARPALPEGLGATFRFRQSLFWDVDPKTINPKRHARYIIERILDFGNDEEVRWMWHTYPRSLIADVVKNSRVLQPQSRNLWRLLTAQM